MIGQSNCLLPILGVSLAGIRRSFVLIVVLIEHFFKVIRKSFYNYMDEELYSLELNFRLQLQPSSQ